MPYSVAVESIHPDSTSVSVASKLRRGHTELT